jgi:hypothetical protein
MRITLLAILLLAPALAWAAKPAPNPADYTITVHVQSSRAVNLVGRPGVVFQHLTVSIDGKMYELDEARPDAVFPLSNLLRVGDYKARIDKDDTKRAYEYRRVYEFLFTDGTTRQYVVTGEGE